MEYVYAALLLHKLKQNITEDSVKNVVKAAGVTPDDVRVKALVAALSEVQIDEALKAAPVAVAEQLAAPAGGGASAPQLEELGRSRRRGSSQRRRKEGRRSPRGSVFALWLASFQTPFLSFFIIFFRSNNASALSVEDIYL